MPVKDVTIRCGTEGRGVRLQGEARYYATAGWASQYRSRKEVVVMLQGFTAKRGLPGFGFKAMWCPGGKE